MTSLFIQELQKLFEVGHSTGDVDPLIKLKSLQIMAGLDQKKQLTTEEGEQQKGLEDANKKSTPDS